MLIRKNNILVILVFFVVEVYSQSVINSTGVETTNATGSVSYSVGITSYTTVEGEEGFVAQGVQHSYQVFALSTSSLLDLNKKINVYPNPTKDYINFTMTDYETNSFCNMTDVNGKIIITKKINSDKTILDMKKLPPAIYFLRIYKNKKSTQVFKIIKN